MLTHPERCERHINHIIGLLALPAKATALDGKHFKGGSGIQLFRVSLSLLASILLNLFENTLTDELGNAHLLLINIITQLNHPWLGDGCLSGLVLGLSFIF